MRYSTAATVSGDTNGAQRGELIVESDNVFEPGRGLYVMAKDRTEVVGFWLREVDARTLAEKLAERYGLVPLAAPKVGDEVTLLPGTRYSGGSIDVGTSTRFKVMFGADGDGDLSVRALDGDREDRDFYVLPQYLRSASAILPKPEAPAEPAKPAFELSQAVTLTETHAGLSAGTTGLVRGKTAAGTGWRIVVVERGLAVNKVVPESKLAPMVKAEAEPVAAPYEPKIGDVVTLRPEFRMSAGSLSYLWAEGRTTKAKIDDLADPDGDFWVTALDGSCVGQGGYVTREYIVGLAEAPAADRPWAVGDEAIVTQDRPRSTFLFAGDRVKIAGPCPLGAYMFDVDFVAGRGRSGGYHVKAEHLRRP